MSLVSERFLLFAFVLVVAFYLIPQKWQWLCLLVASCFFYASAGLGNCIYIAITALSAYGAGWWMQSLDDRRKCYIKEHRDVLDKDTKKALKTKTTARKKWIMIACLVLNFGLLCVFKYAGFVLKQVNELVLLFGGAGINAVWELMIPLGISFYTFQTMGYVVDVYWEKCPAEKNFAKLLLFTSFFPQVTQGPISSYGQLAPQLCGQHTYSDKNITFGFQRMLWGYFKKMVLADSAALLVRQAFSSYETMPGNALIVGAFLYSLQIYADFSGYMDIICGLCEMLDIRLTENFLRPYFSKSVAEYWRRWHISLGDWFKSYIYYPVAVSRASKRLSKWGTKVFGAAFGKTLAASLALIVVWLTTGLWHGANWGYIVWGGINGLCIIISLWLEPVYEKMKARCHIRQSSFLWRAFITLRTFFLVTMIKVFPEVGGFTGGIGYWKHCFMNWDLHGFAAAFDFSTLSNRPTLSKTYLILIAGGALLLFIISLLQRKGSVRVQLTRLPRIVRLAIFVAMFFLIIFFGYPLSAETGGFLYAQF